MSEKDFDSVSESAARYGDGEGAKHDPKTGRFVSGAKREKRKMTLDESIQHTTKRYGRALKKLAE